MINMAKAMRRHRSFEFLAGKYLQQQGYQVEVTQGVADWGVDAFATKDGKKIVAQCKMYGDCKTKINRRQIMELCGVMHYFDCQEALIIYNGSIMPDAVEVAQKLGIQLVYLDQHLLEQLQPDQCDLEDSEDEFETIWNDIRQLEGQVIRNDNGTSYTILKVTDGDVTYRNANGKRHRESADLIRRIVARIWSYGCIEQCQLRGEFDTKASAFITTLLGKTCLIEVTPHPNTLWQAERLDLESRFHIPVELT